MMINKKRVGVGNHIKINRYDNNVLWGRVYKGGGRTP